MVGRYEADGFDARIEELEEALGGAEVLTAAFSTQLRDMQSAIALANRDIATLKSGISGGLRRAFDGVVKDGDRLSDALKTVGRSMIDAAYSAAVRPVTDQLGGALAGGLHQLMGGLLPFADGATFSQGRVRPFASGGIVASPVQFPMRGGIGLMGEAGPEAIMPLSRGTDGKLGVRAQGNARPVNVTINISTPDVEGFRRSQSQIAAQVQRALGAGSRNR